MLAKLSIRAKIIAVISVLLVVMAAMGVFAIRQMQAINANAVDIQTNWLPSVRILGELRANTITYRVVVRSHILAPDAAGKVAAEKTMESVAQSVDKSRKAYEAYITSPEERAIYTEFSELWTAYGAAVQELLVLSRKNDINESLNLNNTKANPIAIKADEVLKKDVDLNNRGADVAGQDASDSYAAAFKMVVALLVVAVLLGIGIGFYLVRDISSAIASIITPMRALGSGDLTAVVPHQGEATEIGAMADTLQVF